MFLAGDVGGTKTTLAIFAPEQGVHGPVVEATLPSGDYPTFEALVRSFLDGVGLPVERACFGVAGPVVAGRAVLTNLTWVIDAAVVTKSLGLSSVRLLNDLEATAAAVPFLAHDDLVSLHAIEPALHGAIAVIAPGTGLGEAFLTWDGTCYRAHPSEGGHRDFAPADARQTDLLAYLLERYDHVSSERVCSGMGIPNIYAWLKDRDIAAEPEWLAAALASSADPTRVIVTAALDERRPAELCRATLDIFIDILAAEAGNLALTVLATGGIYVGGGIPRRILPLLTAERFMRAFRRKGRLSGLLDRIPVRVIRTPKAALLGAARAVVRDA